MTEKGCGNCYYSFFDERAYPCSLCIRGIERTDQWQPSRETKADRKTEPQKDCKKCKNYEKCKNNKWKCCVYQPIEDEPQTEDLQDWKDRMWAEAVIASQTGNE